MGAWGVGIFENDEACDFIDDVMEADDLSRLREALDEVLKADDELDAVVATEGLAAADIVAQLRGFAGDSDSYTEELDRWVRSSKLTPGDDLATKAKAVVERVRTEPSELLELWADSDDHDAWLATLDALTLRLNGVNRVH